MRVLHTVEFYSPSVGGAQEVVKQVSEVLVQDGHQVTVATSALPSRSDRVIHGVRIVEFPISGNQVRGYSGPTEDYQRFLKQGPFDVMMNYAAQQWTADLAFPVIDQLGYPAVLATCGFSGLPDPAYAAYFARMPDVLRKYRRIILHSETYRDGVFARKSGISHISVIPNGASEREFAIRDDTFRNRYGIAADVPLLVTIGSHTGVKGHRATIESFRRARIGPAVLLVIGNVFGAHVGCRPDCRRRAFRCNVLSLGRKRVLVLDPPRADVVAALQSADLFLFASNIECSPIVLFEAMASRTAFASVACGNAEEIIRWSGGGILIPSHVDAHGLVQTDVAAMARCIEALIADRARRVSLAEAGNRAWRERFGWAQVARSYEATYQNVVKVHGR